VRAAPGPSAPAARDITLTTADGATLTGRAYGSGPSAVVLSNMGDNDPTAWDAFAPGLAARGHLVVTYRFRYPLRTNAFTAAMAAGTVADLRAAVAYAQAQGATRIVLIGASLGAMASARVAAEQHRPVVVISAGRDLSAYGLVISPEEVGAIAAPALFVASDEDATVPAAATKEFHDQARDPRRLVTYPGSAHGVAILGGPHGPELERLLTAFAESPQ
jgi:uncharacterized protein